MPDSTDPTQTSDLPSSVTPADHLETRDAPPAAEPPTGTAHTHTQNRDPVTATADPTTGRPKESLETLPGFDILREIGSGGMGVVYEARQTRLNRLVALKVLRGARAEPKDLIRFLAEAEAVAAIRHPHVVQVYETGQEAGRPYMVLELLTGGTLQARLSAGKLDPRDAAALIAKLADAIQAAHELGIVHRDLKPSNVLFENKLEARNPKSETEGKPSSVSNFGFRASSLEPKVTDFGLAKRVGGVDLTRTQAVMGTPAYMAPEQAKGDTKFVGPAADIWALGAILYECLTGKRPFDAQETFAILRKVIEEQPPRPRDHVPGLPRDLELIALKCLEKSPADRYPSAAALADDLQRFLDGKPVSVRPAGSVERATKWVRRNPVVAGATAAVALALLVGTGVSLAFGLEARKRGKELEQANNDLTSAQAEQEKVNKKLRSAYELLSDTFGELAEQKAATEERGYLSDVALAHQLWKANDLAGMSAALERCPPERRKWEWHYLKGISRPERAEHITDAPPLSLAYSQDGKWLAWITFHGTLAVHSRETDRPRHTIPGGGNQSNRNASLAFHPGGNELAYIMSGRVRVVDLATGNWKELKDPNQPDGNPGNRNGNPSIAVGYTPEGQLRAAAIGSGKKPGTREIIIRDAVTAKPISTFFAFDEPTNAWGDVAYATFSPDGNRFAISVVDSSIRVRSGKEPEKADIGVTPRAIVWEVESGNRLGQAEAGSNLLTSLAFDPSGTTVGFGRRGVAGEFEAKLGAPARIFAGHTADVTAVAFDRNGLIWSGGEDKVIRAHDRKAGTERFALRGCTRTILRLAVSPDGKEVAAAVGDIVGPGGAIYRFDVSALPADEWRAAYAPSRISVITTIAADGSRFAACSFIPFDERPESYQFVTRDIANGLQRTVTPAGHWLRGTFAPDGRAFVLEREMPRARVERIRVIDPDGTLSHIIAAPKVSEQEGAHAAAIACTPDGRTLAWVTANTVERVKLPARLRTVDLETRQARDTGDADLSDLLPPKAQFASLQPMGLAIDRDSKRLAATFAAGWQPEGISQHELRGALVVWDLTTGKVILRKNTVVPLYAATFEGTTRVAVAGGSPAGGMVFGWDIDTGNEFLSLRSHTRPILSLAFGPDNRLVTGGADRVVKLWDVASKREVLTLDGFSHEVAHLAFTKDGKNLVAGTGLDMLSAATAAGIPTDWPPAEVRVFRGSK